MMTTPAPTLRARLWRWTKRSARVTTLLLMALVPIVGIGLPVLARQEWTRHRVEKVLGRALGTPVEITAVSWSWKEGLTLRNVASSEETSFRIDSIRLQPNFSRLTHGSLRVRAILESPEFVVGEPGSEAPQLRLPRFPKKGIRLEDLEIRHGTCIVKGAGEDRILRIDDLTIQGTGRLENRILRMELDSVSGSLDGMTFTGKGVLRLRQEGLSGEFDLNEATARESTDLRSVLRTVHVTLKKSPALSEPF